MRWFIAAALLIQGCSFSYQFEPIGKGSNLKVDDVAKALGQRDRAIELLTKRIEALEPKKKEIKK